MLLNCDVFCQAERFIMATGDVSFLRKHSSRANLEETATKEMESKLAANGNDSLTGGKKETFFIHQSTPFCADPCLFIPTFCLPTRKTTSCLSRSSLSLVFDQPLRKSLKCNSPESFRSSYCKFWSYKLKLLTTCCARKS